MNFYYNEPYVFLSVISTTTAIATRAPCGPTCACYMNPCPVVVVTNPCMPNPWLVYLIDLTEILAYIFV
jgi:hypothetical protein